MQNSLHYVYKKFLLLLVIRVFGSKNYIFRVVFAFCILYVCFSTEMNPRIADAGVLFTVIIIR